MITIPRFLLRYLFSFSKVNILYFQILCVLILPSIKASKVCKENYIDVNIAKADVILAGTVKKLDRNYSNELYAAQIEIHRIMKGRARVYDLLNLEFTPDENKHLRLKSNQIKKKRITFSGDTIQVYNFGSPDICESNVKPHDVGIFLVTIDENEKFILSSSVVPPVSKELRNLHSLFENQFTDRCKRLLFIIMGK